jgi:hypothetical protein
MLKKLTLREASGEQKEFEERTAHGCFPDCRDACHSVHPDHFVVDFTILLNEGVTIGGCR